MSARQARSELDRLVDEKLFNRMVEGADRIVQEHKESQMNETIQLITFKDGPLIGEKRRFDTGGDGGEYFRVSVCDVHGDQHTYQIHPGSGEAYFCEPPSAEVKIDVDLAHAILDVEDICYNEGLGPANEPRLNAWLTLVGLAVSLAERETVRSRSMKQVLQLNKQNQEEAAEAAQAGQVTE